MQYVRDVAEAFVQGTLSTKPGAHVFNLQGDVIRMDDLIRLLDRLRPGAAGLITAAGPQVPVAWRMDDSRLRGYLPGLTKTSLENGISFTLQKFEELLNQGRLA